MTRFSLHARLERDTLLVGDLPLCRVLLLNDSRFPWVLLVPRQAGLVEIHELNAADRYRLADETALVSRVLQSIVQLQKINTGALGNMVQQLHIHVVARHTGDAAWPGPVWGAGAAVAYSDTESQRLVDALRTQLSIS